MQQSSTPLVSVVISTFRRPHFLNQALDSVYAQTFTDFEVIVADDGSGEEHTSQYNLRSDTKLVCHTEAGRGSACTRNTGTRVARGRYVAYLDDDDIWLPEKLERQVRTLEDDPDTGLTYCHYTLVDPELKRLDDQPELKIIAGKCTERLVRANIIKSPSCVLVRRDVLEKAGLFDERLRRSEDWAAWARVSHFCSFHFDETPLVLYRVHPSQKTASSATERRRGQVRVTESIREWVEKEAPPLRVIVRRSLAYRLQRLSRWEAHDGDYRSALKSIWRSISLHPLCFRPYCRLFQVAWYALRYRGRAA